MTISCMEMLFLFSKHFPMHSPMSVSQCFREVGGTSTTSKGTPHWERESGGRPRETPRSGERAPETVCGQASSQPAPPQVRVPSAGRGWKVLQSVDVLPEPLETRRGSQVLCQNHSYQMKESSGADPQRARPPSASSLHRPAFWAWWV